MEKLAPFGWVIVLSLRMALSVARRHAGTNCAQLAWSFPGPPGTYSSCFGIWDTSFLAGYRGAGPFLLSAVCWPGLVILTSLDPDMEYGKCRVCSSCCTEKKLSRQRGENERETRAAGCCLSRSYCSRPAQARECCSLEAWQRPTECVWASASSS